MQRQQWKEWEFSKKVSGHVAIDGEDDDSDSDKNDDEIKTMMKSHQNMIHLFHL